MHCRTLVCTFVASCAASIALPAQILTPEYAARRAALGLLAGDAAILVLGAGEPLRDFETFAPSAQLRYLTGWKHPNAALLIVREGGKQRDVLFVPARSPAQEVWTGIRPSLADASTMTGLATRNISELTAAIDSVLATKLPIRLVGELDGQTGPTGDAVSSAQALLRSLRARRPDVPVTDGNDLVLHLRRRKSPAEIALLRTSIRLTVLAHEEAMRMAAPGWNEFEVQALVEYIFRRGGAERPSFTSIVGSGDNATTLHYWQNDRAMQDGELAVMDIGASYAGYAADVTRTLPIGGRFSTEQRAIYDLVRRAQLGAELVTRVGAQTMTAGVAARDSLAAGLARLGLIDSATARYDCDAKATAQCRQVGLFYMHALGHGIGLDVHDPDISDTTNWQAGSVVTIEPGIYVRRNLAEVLPDTPQNRALLARIAPTVAKYAGIGVRIEDDYLLSDAGLEWLSKLPRESADVEAAMRTPRATAPRPRDAALVERYPRGQP